MSSNMGLKKELTGKQSPVRNFKLAAKLSFEKQIARNGDMVDTLDSFFDQNKLYIKSVQHEQTLRGKRPSKDDSLYEEIRGGEYQGQMVNK